MKEDRKILLITDLNFPYGGASANFLRLFSKGVVENGYSIEVLLQRGNQFGKTINKSRNGIVNDVNYTHCCFSNRPKYNFLKIVDDICGIFFPVFFILKKRLTGRLNYVIMYNSNALYSFLILFICRIFSIPIFNFVVEWYEKESLISNSPLGSLKWIFFKTQFEFLNKKFSALIVLTHFLKKYYLLNNLCVNKIHVQPNFIDFESFKLNSLGAKGDFVKIGYCGTPTHKDGIDDLFTAFHLLQNHYINMQLLIIGDLIGTDSLIPELKEKAKTLGIFDKIIFTGLVGYLEIPKLLHSCDILVLARPSGKFAEAGFPTKLGEYMACKKPVVITKVGDIPFYLKDCKNAMLAEPDNPKSVADKIAFLIENPESAKKIGIEGYNWAKSVLEYKNAAKNIIDFIVNLREND